ncbi:hypothetical protein Tco_1437838 [Tanacetum coccineum]
MRNRDMGVVMFDVVEEILLRLDVEDLLRCKSVYDYKLVVGIRNGDHRTCFHLLTLKSNVWRLVGDVNFSFNSHFNNEEFQEIPLPDDTRYVRQFFSWLGIMEECLCIFTSDYNPTWVMESYNVKQSWKMLPMVPNMKYDLRRPLNCISPYTSWSLCDDKDDTSSWGWLYLGAYFVKALNAVSSYGKQRK